MTKKQKKLRLEYGGPVRSCIVCRRQQAKNKLLRLVRTAAGLLYDPDCRAPGRGFYLCRRPECLKALLDGRRRFPRLKAGIKLAGESRAVLEAMVSEKQKQI